MISKSSVIQKPELLFLAIALLFGVGLCFLIPVGAGFDESTHLARIWEISGGTIIPNQKLSQGPFFPNAFAEVSYRSRFFYTPVEKDFLTKYGGTRIDWNNFNDTKTRAVYFPLMYLPQAFIVGVLGRVLNAPILWMYYLSRLVNVLIYGLLGYLAIKAIPFGKWLLALMALAPMALFQAGTISSDPFSDGASLLFIGWVLALAWRGRPLTWKQIGVTLTVTGLLLAGKPGTVFLLLLLALLPWRKTLPRQRWVLLAGALALFAVEAVAWNALIYPDYYINVPGYGAGPQLRYILAHPLAFLGTFFNDIYVHGETYVKNWIGIYAYNTGRVPDVVYPFYGLAAAVLCLVEPAPDQAPGIEEPEAARRRWKWLRSWLVAACVFGYLFTVIGMYLTTNSTGSPFIEGVQGRYFLIVFPLLFLALIGLLPSLSGRLSTWRPQILLVSSLLALLPYVGGVYFTYYVTCGTSYYTSGFCYQPSYRNWDPNAHFSPPVTKDVILSQSFQAVCAPVQSVRVWNGRTAAQPLQSTTITLRDAATGAQLASRPVDNSGVKPNSWLEMPVPAIDNAVGRQFTIEITSPASNANSALEFGLSERREYSQGQYLMNGQEQPADLLFQYGCDAP